MKKRAASPSGSTVCLVTIAALTYIRKPEALAWSPLAAVPAWFGVTICGRSRGDWGPSASSAAQSGHPPRDGEGRAIGRIAASGESLVSPFSKTPCVIYEYKIVSGFTTDDSNLYVGSRQSPSTIQTRHGSIRLLAHPDLKLREQVVEREIALPNATEYIAATQFTESSVANPSQSLQTVLDTYKDDDGAVRYDARVLGAQAVDRAFFVEKLVRPGDEVCVIGVYSTQRSGIVPDLKSPLINQTTLEPGGGDAPLGRARRGLIGYAIGACIFLGIVAVGYFFLL